MKINIQKLTPTATIPTKGSCYSAGFDLYADINATIVIPPHCTSKIHTGIAVELPNGYFGAIVARSGIATKEGLAPANKIGVCDEDYRGEYIVALHNHSDEYAYVHSNERIAQLIIMPYLSCELNEVDVLTDTERGTGGFGSTGK